MPRVASLVQNINWLVLSQSARASLLFYKHGCRTPTGAGGAAFLPNGLITAEALLKHFDKIDNVGRHVRGRRFGSNLFVLGFLLDDLHQRRSILVPVFLRLPCNRHAADESLSHF